MEEISDSSISERDFVRRLTSVLVTIFLIPATVIVFDFLNSQITTENAEFYQAENGQYVYPVPNDKSSFTYFYFTTGQGSCHFTDYAESQSLWHTQTHHHTFWCIENEHVIYRTPSTPDGVWEPSRDPVYVEGNQISSEYRLHFYSEPETALMVTVNYENNDVGGTLFLLIAIDIFIIIKIFQRPEKHNPVQERELPSDAEPFGKTGLM